MNCAYQRNDGPCGEPIVRDETSYSGFSHERGTDTAGQKIDWLHWATPVPYSVESRTMNKVFVPCAICGKLGPENKEHVYFLAFGGHAFRAQERRHAA